MGPRPLPIPSSSGVNMQWSMQQWEYAKQSMPVYIQHNILPDQWFHSVVEHLAPDTTPYAMGTMKSEALQQCLTKPTPCGIPDETVFNIVALVDYLGIALEELHAAIDAVLLKDRPEA